MDLGTGNDLARTLNWGGGYKKNESIDKILDKVINGSIVQLDRLKKFLIFDDIINFIFDYFKDGKLKQHVQTLKIIIIH